MKKHDTRQDPVEITYGQLNDILIAAYTAGFMASHQSWNGEFPFRNRLPQSQQWKDQAQSNLTRVIHEHLKEVSK